MDRSRTAVLRAWVRSQPSTALHGLAWKLNRISQERDLSSRQEWLFQLATHELELRHRTAEVGEKRCYCDLCVSPFDSPELGSANRVNGPGGGADYRRSDPPGGP